MSERVGSQFPKGFIWGAATSSYQVEGGNYNNWSEWEQVAGHIKDGSAAGKATGHWRRYRDDFGLLEELGLNGYRCSIEWSRVEPQPGVFDETAIAQYADMVADLRRRGVRVMVTLHHFTNPVWVEEQGGWANRRTVAYFERFAMKMVERLGEQVQLWCTLNEPSVETGLGYAVGTFPPGRKNLWAFMRARRNLVAAHRRLYSEIHELYEEQRWPRPWVSFAHHMSYVEPYRRHSLLDRLVTWGYDRINNGYFLERTRGTLDFVGVNYYFYRRLRFGWGGPLGIAREVPVEGAVESDLDWQVVPEGLYRICKRLAALHKPIYVTENGLADAADSRRAWSIIQHVRAVERAIADGADVRGYFHWSLTDTFEWENGYRARYGLVKVDFATQKRTVRKSARVYGKVARANGVSAELAEEYS
jgi:beta-glucosidase